VIKLIAVFDRDKHDHPRMLTHVYKMYFLCEIVGGEIVETLESSESKFFKINSLPELSTSRVLHEHLELCETHYKNPK
jgi:ADP-ribose pyrophosphatase YjhB (NUDIX family)